MTVEEADALIAHALETGHVAHGYLICGELGGNTRELARRVIVRLFPDAPETAADGTHPDVSWLEPANKSRSISVEAVRERLVEPMAVTSFSGGWKVGVVVGADRLRQEAANAFLKTLEEPPPQTLFLLLTDQPDMILPTIVSRSQRIDLPRGPGLLEGEAYAAVAAVFGDGCAEGSFARGQAGGELAEIFKSLKDEVAPEEVALVRKRFFRTVMSFVRAWMVGGRLPAWRAFANVEAVEEAYRRCEESIPDEAVLRSLMDRLAMPPKEGRA